MGNPKAELCPLEASAKGTHYHLIYFSFVQRVSQLFSVMQQKGKLSMECPCAEKLQEFPIYSSLMIAWYFVGHLWRSVMSFSVSLPYMNRLQVSSLIKPRLLCSLVKIPHVQYKRRSRLDLGPKSFTNMKNTWAYPLWLEDPKRICSMISKTNLAKNYQGERKSSYRMQVRRY